MKESDSVEARVAACILAVPWLRGVGRVFTVLPGFNYRVENAELVHAPYEKRSEAKDHEFFNGLANDSAYVWPMRTNFFGDVVQNLKKYDQRKQSDCAAVDNAR